MKTTRRMFMAALAGAPMAKTAMEHSSIKMLPGTNIPIPQHFTIRVRTFHEFQRAYAELKAMNLYPERDNYIEIVPSDLQEHDKNYPSDDIFATEYSEIHRSRRMPWYRLGPPKPREL